MISDSHSTYSEHSVEIDSSFGSSSSVSVFDFVDVSDSVSDDGFDSEVVSSEGDDFSFAAADRMFFPTTLVVNVVGKYKFVERMHST